MKLSIRRLSQCLNLFRRVPTLMTSYFTFIHRALQDYQRRLWSRIQGNLNNFICKWLNRFSCKHFDKTFNTLKKCYVDCKINKIPYRNISFKSMYVRCVAKKVHMKEYALIKKFKIFTQSLWNFVKRRYSWRPHFDKVW